VLPAAVVHEGDQTGQHATCDVASQRRVHASHPRRGESAAVDRGWSREYTLLTRRMKRMVVHGGDPPERASACRSGRFSGS
jgi:hypothetical protein